MDRHYSQYQEYLINKDLPSDIIKKKMTEAGYFHSVPDVTQIPSYDVNFLSTPFGHILKNLDVTKPQLVVLVTGSFAPFHSGHLNLIKRAKEILEDHGHDVIGGYISPSHDEYVLTKQGTELYCAEDRVEIAREIIQGHSDVSSWCEVDPWECLYVNTSLNFTEVIERLEAYLRHHLNAPLLEVAFAFGEDNQAFTHAFQNGRPHVCIARNVATTQSPKMEDGGFFGYHTNNTVIELNSQKIRSETNRRSIPQQGHVVLRSTNWNGTLLSNEIGHYEEEMTDLIALAYCSRVRVRKRVYEPRVKKDVINLDPITASEYEYNLNISRIFDVSSAQKAPLGYIARPGFPSIEEQIDVIPQGYYTLVDDDQSTGGTIAMVSSLLKQRGRIIQDVETLLENDAKRIDILDIRDFIMGSDFGGLVVNVKGNTYRVPYLLPFVNIRARANITMGNAVIFSRNVFNLNRRLHTKTGMTVKDSPDGFYHDILGYSLDTLLSDIADDYYNILRWASS